MSCANFFLFQLDNIYVILMIDVVFSSNPCTLLASIRSNLFHTGVHANENYNGVHHVGVLCKDISESLAFYKEIHRHCAA